MRKSKGLAQHQQEINLRHHEKSCHSCRYFRVWKSASYCLVLGRHMGFSNKPKTLFEWAMGTICDAWKKRPKTWSVVATRSPLWHDRHIPRATQKRFRR